jgi:SAM-dependent methyltransferase
MSHPAQIKFCKSVKKLYPQHFRRVNVIDVGSLDINGSNRYLFSRSHYIGIDLHEGKNVDVIGHAHNVIPVLEPKMEPYQRKTIWNPDLTRIEYTEFFDTVISTECLEHDQYFNLTLIEMYKKLRPGGLMLITAGGVGRQEHGTSRDRPELSPFTNDYYLNLDNGMFVDVLDPDLFDVYHLAQVDNDLQFYGIKKSLQ